MICGVLRKLNPRHGRGSQEAASDRRPCRWGRGRSRREAAPCAAWCGSCGQERPSDCYSGGVSWHRARRGTDRGSAGHASRLGVGAGFAGASADGGTVVGQVGCRSQRSGEQLPLGRASAVIHVGDVALAPARVSCPARQATGGCAEKQRAGSK